MGIFSVKDKVVLITGSDAYNFCLIAEGKLDILIECGLKKSTFIL